MSNNSNMGDSYSQIISPIRYNKMMNEEHLYIKEADNFIVNTIQQKNGFPLEVVELGCGPARILSEVSKIKSIYLTGIDLDHQFIQYAQQLLKDNPTNIFHANAEHYQHSKPVDVFYSQGFHHHISLGSNRKSYLKNIYNQLKPGGWYILGDEFVPNYKNEQEREVRIVIWYAHVIADALTKGYHYLAQEEAKTLLDDIYEGRKLKSIKTAEQIQLTLNHVEAINKSALTGDLHTARISAQNFLKKLQSHYTLIPTLDVSIDLSRGDYKICDQELRKEVEPIGFRIEKMETFGPIDTIGGMVVYILSKA